MELDSIKNKKKQLCIHEHLIHFFTIDPLGSKFACYMCLSAAVDLVWQLSLALCETRPLIFEREPL